MPAISRNNGIRIEVPRGYEIVAPRRPTRARRGGRIVQAASSATGARETDAIIETLTRHDLSLADSIELQATAAPGRTRALARGASRIARLQVDVDAGEHAVLLVQQDGMYSWSFPLPVTGAGRRAVRGARRAPARQLTFEVPLHTTITPSRRAQRGLSDLVTKVAVGKATAFVFKFVAGAVLGEAVTLLERKVERGPGKSLALPWPNGGCDRPSAAWQLNYEADSSRRGPFASISPLLPLHS